MSHYTILVIGEDIESQLAPYDENITVAPYVDGSPEETSRDLARALKYFAENPAGLTPEQTKYIGREVGSLSIDEQLEVLAQYTGGEYRQDEQGFLVRYTTYNPTSKWDWYQVGGRWSGFFTVKPGTPPEAIRQGERSWTNEGRELAPDLADSVEKKYIDFDLMRRKAEIEAHERWEKFEKAVGDLRSPGSWDSYARAIVGAELWDKDLSDLSEEQRAERKELVDKAREAYRAEPFIKAATGLGGFYFGDIHTDMCLDAEDPRATFVQSAMDATVSTYAVVKDGDWMARGQMGWFGMSDDKDDEATWAAKVWELVESLPDDTLLTVVDAHI
jgi:hypothetical protein